MLIQELAYYDRHATEWPKMKIFTDYGFKIKNHSQSDPWGYVYSRIDIYDAEDRFASKLETRIYNSSSAYPPSFLPYPLTVSYDPDTGFLMVGQKTIYNTITGHSATSGGYRQMLDKFQGLRFFDSNGNLRTIDSSGDMFSKKFNIIEGYDNNFSTTGDFVLYPAYSVQLNCPIPNLYFCANRIAVGGDRLTDDKHMYVCCGSGVFWYKES